LQLRAAWSFAQVGFDHMPGGEAVAVHKALGDLVGNALVAQSCDQATEQGGRVSGADRFPQLFFFGSETGFVDEGGGAGDVADPQDQVPSMG
jgi:hypothetical protein